MKLILRFENKIISLCRAKSITKERVFELANIPTYKRNVSVNELDRIAKILEVQIAELL